MPKRWYWTMKRFECYEQAVRAGERFELTRADRRDIARMRRWRRNLETKGWTKNER